MIDGWITGDPDVESVESLYNVVSLSIYLDCVGVSTFPSFVDGPGFGDPEYTLFIGLGIVSFVGVFGIEGSVLSKI